MQPQAASATPKIVTRMKPSIRTSLDCRRGTSPAAPTKIDDLGYPSGPFQVYHATGFGPLGAARTETPEHKHYFIVRTLSFEKGQRGTNFDVS